MNIHTHRRKRRRANAKATKGGYKKVRKHQRKAGRTGSIDEKQTTSKKHVHFRTSRKQSPPSSVWRIPFDPSGLVGPHYSHYPLSKPRKG